MRFCAGTCTEHVLRKTDAVLCGGVKQVIMEAGGGPLWGMPGVGPIADFGVAEKWTFVGWAKARHGPPQRVRRERFQPLLPPPWLPDIADRFAEFFIPYVFAIAPCLAALVEFLI